MISLKTVESVWNLVASMSVPDSHLAYLMSDIVFDLCFLILVNSDYIVHFDYLKNHLLQHYHLHLP